ncbi:unnamed protein product [Closterium sp. NIES-64]|nr:unnamed protein product [Closterium sp. NIES-65]CAI5978477.1 unnamed protein product [Closterium sp. NIES-64]
MAHPVCISQSSPSSPSPFHGFLPPHPPSTVSFLPIPLPRFPSSPSPVHGFFPPHPPSSVSFLPIPLPRSSGQSLLVASPHQAVSSSATASLCLTVPHMPHIPNMLLFPSTPLPPNPQVLWAISLLVASPHPAVSSTSSSPCPTSCSFLHSPFPPTLRSSGQSLLVASPHPALSSSSSSASASASLCPMCHGSTGQTLLVASPHPAVSSSSSAAAASVSLCPTCHGSGVMKCSVCNGDAWKNKITFDRVLDSPLKAWDAYRMAKPVMPSPEAMQDPNRAAFWLLQRPAVEEGVEMSERDKEAVWWEHQWNQRYEGMREAVLQKQPGWQQAQQALIEMDPSAALNDPQLDAAVRTKPLKARRLPKLEGDAEARVAAALEEAWKKVEKMTPPPRPKDFGSFQLDWVQEPDQSKIKGEAERQQWQAMLQQQREVEEKMLDAAWRDTWQNDKVEESLKKAISRMKAADEAARRAKAAEAAAAAGGGAAAGAAAGGGVGGKGGAASSGGKAAGKKSSGGDKGKGKGKPCVNWACNRPIGPKGHSTAHP